MVRFGRFETVHEIHRTGLVAVYSAREAGGPEEKYAVKVFKPSSSVLEEDIVAAESLRHLNSAGIQQNVSSGSAQHWARVYECGPSAEGDFYVTDRYDRSLQQLIDGRIRISGPVLHMIVDSIAKGLMELREACGRAHGNLKATNVLIAGTGDISQTQIVVSDPSPEEEADSRASWNRDLRAVGELIYELITHRPTPAVDGWQAPDSPEWAKLGQKADGWRRLCNLLLGSAGKSDAVALDAVLEEIEKLREVKSLFSTRRLIAAGAVLIACIAVLLALILRPPPPPNEEDWRKLCDAYKGWVRDLRASSNEPEAKILWIEDEQLRELLADEIKTACYPSDVIRLKSQADIEDVEGHPEWAEDVKTQAALAAIEHIGRFFDPNSPNAWRALARTNVAANKLRDRGWEQSAAYLSDLVEGAVPEPNKPIIKNVNMILEIDSKDMNEIDWEMFNTDHRDYLAENSTEQPLTFRADKIREYYKLYPDPNEVMSKLIKEINGYIEEARIYSGARANACAEKLTGLEPEIDGIREIRPIAKNEQDIRKRMNECKPQLDECLREVRQVLVTAIGTVGDALELCYQLDDTIPQADRSIRLVWQRWEDASILREDQSVSEAMMALKRRIDRLREVEQSSEPSELIPIAMDRNVEIEVAYAAWTRLGGSEVPRPKRHRDLQQYRDIRDRLRKDFENIKGRNEARADHLLAELAGAGIEYETEFIEENRSGDEALGRLVQHAIVLDRFEFPSDCNRIESSVRDIADFLATENWRNDKNDKFDTVLFATDTDFYKLNTEITAQTFAEWLEQVKDYRRLQEDHREDSRFSWDKKLPGIKAEIDNEFARNPQGDQLAKLEELKTEFDRTTQRINEMRIFPLIEKHREEIEKSDYYWGLLQSMERKLRPEYCVRLDIDEQGRLIFATNALGPNFVPVDVDSKSSLLVPERWKEIRENQSRWRDFFHITDANDVLNVGWPKYVMWTSDASAPEDPNVILRFIPAGPGNSEPFYMSTHEITNEQYRFFLDASRAGNLTTRENYYWFTDPDGKALIQCIFPDKPATAIRYDEVSSTFRVAEDAKADPVTWVTFHGAQAYCTWFGGQLPSPSQHKYACAAETGDVRPWGDNVSEIGSYAHVRGPLWRQAAQAWNRNLRKKEDQPRLSPEFGTASTGDSDPDEPIGAIEDRADPDRRTLDPNAIVVGSDLYDSHWPVATAPKAVETAREANAWGLHDMIGNVWEWCLDSKDANNSYICGGSCLAPPRYILLDPETDHDDYKVSVEEFAGTFDEKEESWPRGNDIGFRVIVPVKQP